MSKIPFVSFIICNFVKFSISLWGVEIQLLFYVTDTQYDKASFFMQTPVSPCHLMR